MARDGEQPQRQEQRCDQTHDDDAGAPDRSRIELDSGVGFGARRSGDGLSQVWC